MRAEFVETIETSDKGRRISVSDYDESVWLSLNVPGGSTWCALTKPQAELLISAIRKVLDAA